MRTLHVVLVAAAAAVLFAAPANAGSSDCIRVGNNLYGNCWQRPPHRPNVRMPYTQQNVGGRQVLILPPPRHAGFGGGRGQPQCKQNRGDWFNPRDGRCHPGPRPRGGFEEFEAYRERGISFGPAPMSGGYSNSRGYAMPNGNGDNGAKKQRFLAGCEGYGAPVRELGGGRLNCHIDSHTETYIDGVLVGE